ncbi:Subunit of heteropentameric Replication factor C (RF-C), variant 2 [Homalodisca vitripennis]|nr:Subunit of heteropentameric Replication factor C (RF-C), variant 2 [Homalodisca vitripennis]
MALLRELYGPGVERLRMEHLNFQTPSNKKLDIMTLASNYHIQVNPSDAGIYDRVVVMELIKNAAQTHQLDSSGQREFKVILLDEVDRLTKDAQHALRRTMEKYIATCRLILSANSISQVIPAIRSRCLGIRVPAPTHQEIVSILQSVCKKEGLVLPGEFADKIAEKCDRNLRRAILMCEACKVQQYPFTNDQKIAEPDWQVFLRDTAKAILQEQSPAKLMAVRTRLYELLVHGIPVNVVFKWIAHFKSLQNPPVLSNNICYAEPLIMNGTLDKGLDIVEVREILRKLKDNEAPGYDRVRVPKGGKLSKIERWRYQGTEIEVGVEEVRNYKKCTEVPTRQTVEITIGLLKELLKNCDIELKPQVVELAATYEHQCYRGSKTIFHLEAFVAQFMAIYLRFMEENVGNMF